MNTVMQKQMDLRDVRKKPLLTIEAVAARIGENISRDDVMELIDLGVFAWAWNIASRHATRMEVRILEASVASYLQTGGLREEPRRDWPNILSLVLPGLSPNAAGVIAAPIDCAKLMRLWGASSELGIDLVKEGSLPIVKGTRWGRGPGGTAQLTREGVIAFLESRKL